MEEDLINFSQKENWEIAYTHMQLIGKSVKEISDDYKAWKAEDGGYGFAIYTDPKNKIELYFIATNKQLADFFNGDEICVGFAGNLNLLFPDARGPNTISETEEYLKSFLGLNFELDSDCEDGYLYFIDLEQNNYSIQIWTENGIIMSDTGVLVTRNNI